MGFGIFEALWRTITGKVVWSKEVDLGGEGRISVRLKSKDALLYAVMVFHTAAGGLYYPMDRADLEKLAAALLATRTQLDAARRAALAREQEAELMRRGFAARLWHWISDAVLWREDVAFGNGMTISFRVRRKVDQHAYIVFMGGEATHHLPVRLAGLQAIEESLLATKAAWDAARAQERGRARCRRLSSRTEIGPMDIKARLTQEVEKCLERITSFSWDAYAKAIRRRDPYPAGDTFGFEADGVYFDVGDSAEWLDKPEGDILLKAFVTAFTSADDEDGIREERSQILKRPEPGISNWIARCLKRIWRRPGEGR